MFYAGQDSSVPHVHVLPSLRERYANNQKTVWYYFEQVYDERFEKDYGFYRLVISEVVRAYLKCGDLKEVGARVRCPIVSMFSVFRSSLRKFFFYNRKLLSMLCKCAADSLLAFHTESRLTYRMAYPVRCRPSRPSVITPNGTLIFPLSMPGLKSKILSSHLPPAYQEENPFRTFNTKSISCSV